MKRIVITIITTLICLSGICQNKRWAIVELSSIYIRTAPDYESPLETQELMGTIVEITGEKGYWREINCPQPYQGWCTEKGLIEMSDQEIETYKVAPKCIFTGLYGHIYEKPSFSSNTICDLVGGDIMRVIHKGRWTQVMLPSGKKGWVKSSMIREHAGFRSVCIGDSKTPCSDQTMDKIISLAFSLKGTPYLWGGMTPKGVDCSGLVRWCFLMNGILLPRNASQMIQCGEEVSLDSIQRGDLLFFGTPATPERAQKVTHVGIYIGNGRMIHASQVVRINSLNPSEEDYYENSHRLLAAKRMGN